MLISELARQAHVSAATVSRAINQPHIVAPESLARIRAIMKQHNYVPAPIERRRGPKNRQGEMRKIGVLFVGAKTGNPNLNWFQEQLHQVQTGNPRYRVNLSVLYADSPDELPRDLNDHKLDGLIIQGLEPSRRCMEKISIIPHVWFMTRRTMEFPGDFVEPDNEENGRIAAEFLKSRGHQFVAAIAGNPGYSAVSRRVEAFTQHAQAIRLRTQNVLGKPSRDVSFPEVEPFGSATQILAERYLASKPRPTGIYMPTDHFCGAFFRALRDAGLTPNRDYAAVIGNYNPMIYHNLDHLPAAIDINLPTLVRKVIDHLLWRIENPDATGRIAVTVSPTLILPPTSAPSTE